MKQFYNDYILKYLHNHFQIIPVNHNKSPKINHWREFEEKKVDFQLLKNSMLGIICGIENLEVIDIDNHFGDADEVYQFISDNFDIEKYKIAVQKTGGGGYHLFYKSEKINGNQKLARKIHYIDVKNHIIENNIHYVLPPFSDKKIKLKQDAKGWYCQDTIVETRGTGGYVVFYNNRISGDMRNIPTLTNDQREELHEICKSLNEEIKHKEIQIENDKPGDLYNQDNNAEFETKQILKDAGWKEVKDGYWARPGKEKGISATFGKVGKNKFYVFSTNASPFEDNTSYSMFAVKSILQHNGDFSACAKDLAKRYNINSVKTKTQKKHNKELNQKWQALFDIIEKWNLKIRYNELTRVVEYIRKSHKIWLQDIEILLSDLVFEMENNQGIKSISKNKLHEMIMTRNIVEVFNPIQDFYNSLPAYNNEKNIEKLCNYIDIPSEEDRLFFYEMFKKHLIRTLRTAIETDYVNRIVLVLFGPQDIGKTKIWQWLTPSELYYDEPINLNDKDSIIALSRYVIVNFDDLDQLSKKEVAKLKAYISKGAVNKRLPYARTETRMSRVASFVGTTNLTNILADENNTRWLILKVQSFNWKDYVKNINPLQIWAEAKHYLENDKNSGELTIEEKQRRDHRNSREFLELSRERDILLRYFSEDGLNLEKLTATDIHFLIEKNLYPTKISFYQLTRELRRIYGQPKSTTRNGQSGRYYSLSYNFFAENEIENISVNQKDDIPF